MAAKKTIINQDNNPLTSSALFKDPEDPGQPQKDEKKKTGRPRNKELVRGNSVQEGLTADYTRATFILKVATLEKLKDYAYTERLNMKDAVNDLLESALAAEEKKLAKKGEKILQRRK